MIVFADGRKVEVAFGLGGRAIRYGAELSTAPTSRCRCSPILNGHALSHAGVTGRARASTRVARRQLAALMIERKAADGSRSLLCPMPGLVKAIAVKVGQEVKAGEQLCIVEAMKMENVLERRARRDREGDPRQRRGTRSRSTR